MSDIISTHALDIKQLGSDLKDGKITLEYFNIIEKTYNNMLEMHYDGRISIAKSYSRTLLISGYFIEYDYDLIVRNKLLGNIINDEEV